MGKREKNKLVLYLVVGVLFIIFAFTLHVAGDDFPGTADKSGTDGTYVTGCWDDSGSTPAELTAHITYFNSLPTNLNLTMGGCNNTTDFKFNDNLNVHLAEGAHTCIKFGGNFAWTSSTEDIECEQAVVEINPAEIARLCSDSPEQRQRVWCHETGHGVGLGDIPFLFYYYCMGLMCEADAEYSPDHIAHLQLYY